MDVIYYLELRPETIAAKVKDIVKRNATGHLQRPIPMEKKPIDIEDEIYYYQSPKKIIPIKNDEFFITDSFKALVGEILTPNNFYLIRENDKDKYYNLTDEMAQYYAGFNSGIKAINLLKNQFYAAYLPDSTLIARLQLVYSNPTTSVVFFIDHGLICPIPTDSILILLEKFQQLPPRSFKASLFGHEKDFWSAAETAFFKQLVANKIVQVTINEMGQDLFKCTLVLDRINLNEELINFKVDNEKKLIEF